VNPRSSTVLRRGSILTITAVAVLALSPLMESSAIATSAFVTACSVPVPPTTTTTMASTTTSTSTSTTTTTTTSTTTTTTVPTSTTTSTSTSTTTTVPRRTVLAWPEQGTAAVAVPQLCVGASSPNQPVVPIASLTKMMTAWVVLHKLPLTYAQRGPCLTVTPHDVAVYHHDVRSGQSNAEIVLGERLCEGMLLRGLLVHSAGNFAQLLQSMIGWSQKNFVGVMNRDARLLGLRHTHYVDLTGISPRDRSTASDQASMAVALMSEEPIVDSIVALPSVTLPFAGVLQSYTPLVGTNGVVGVKSGFTDPAGGCDVMAIAFQVGHTTVLTYAVVLGQFGADPLGVAGNAALALSRSLRTSMGVVATPLGRAVMWVGATRYLVVPTTTTTTATSTSSTSSTTTVAGP
jgi:D-alanyl-D-alanine carboxypeptidase